MTNPKKEKNTLSTPDACSMLGIADTGRKGEQEKALIEALQAYFQRKCTAIGPRSARSLSVSLGSLHTRRHINLLENIPVEELDKKITEAIDRYCSSERSGSYVSATERTSDMDGRSH